MSTFFARDMRALINAGVEVDIFAFYPIEQELWRYVPNILNETILPRNRIHHITLRESLRSTRLTKTKLYTFVREMAAVYLSAAKFGTSSLAKTTYVGLKALGWARRYNSSYDHILAYWGNYAATCAYVFHRLLDRPIPFSMFLHAGMDLYEGQVYLKEKLLYADNVFVVCEFNRQFLSEHYTDIFPQISPKIHTYYTGPDFAEFRYDSNSRSGRKILAVGGLEKYKGFHHLLRAGAILCSRGLDYEIDIVGDGKEKNSLKRLAAELQIENRVKFLGYLPSDDEVWTAMTQATVLVHPSVGLGDAVPSVIKESMALGTPVVASNIAGIPELLDGGRCGVLVPPGDPKELADAIETLLTHEGLRLRYADAARRYAEDKFDLWRNGQKLAELLRSTTRVTANGQSPIETIGPMFS
jgi:colanic acid/amylovoran biosynthesis glycosyltransferase